MALHDAASSDHQDNLVGRMDRLPVTKFQLLWISVLAMGYLIETFDNIVFAYLAPSIRQEWGLSIAQVGFVTSMAFVGMFFGAVIGGRLSDRFGRKPVLIWSSILYSFTSLLSALAPNIEILTLSRVLTGVGVQAATGVIMVYVSEMFPNSSRGRFFTVMTFGGFAAGPITSFVALSIAPTGVGAWRWVFAMGTIGVIIALVVALGLPETVRWSVNSGRLVRASKLVQAMESAALRKGPLLPISTALQVPRQVTLRELFRPAYARRLVVLGVSFGLLVFCLYGFVSWVPTVLVGRGLDQRLALTIATYINLASLVTPVVLFGFADRIERKTALLIAGVVGGVSMAVFGSATAFWPSVISGFVVQLALSAATTSFYTYMPEVFPTDIRGVGAGTVNGIGRIAGIASGVSVAAIYSSLGAATLYVILGVGLVVMGLVLAFFGPRTTRRPLEVISEKVSATQQLSAAPLPTSQDA